MSFRGLERGGHAHLALQRQGAGEVGTAYGVVSKGTLASAQLGKMP
jgi:hypothetical protein